jgi:4-amino-4-deoxy-L-arabinose transferase-like glycosyltransferase
MQAAPRRSSQRGQRWRPWLFGLLIFVTAAMLRVAHYQAIRGTVFHDRHIPLLDGRYYDQLARRVLAGRSLSEDAYFMAPLYPYVLAGTYALLTDLPARPDAERASYGDELHTAALLQALGGALTCVLLFWLGCLVAGERVGLLAGLGAAFYSPLIFHDTLIMSTQLVVFTNALAMVLLLRAARGGGIVGWLLGGLALALAILAHGTALVLLPGVVAWILLGDERAPSWRQRLLRSAAVCLPVVVAVGAVAIRNQVVGKDRVLLTSNWGLTFYIGNNAQATGSFMPLPDELARIPGASQQSYRQEYRRQPGDLTPSQMARLLRDRALSEIRADPWRFLENLWRKFRLFWSHAEVGTGDNIYFYQQWSPILHYDPPAFGLLVAIGLTGVVYSLGQARRYLLLYLWLGLQCAAFVATFVLARYRLPAALLLIVFASLQLTRWWRMAAAREVQALLRSLAPLTAFAALAFWPVAGFGRDRGLGEQHFVAAGRLEAVGRVEEAIQSYSRALALDFAPRIDSERRLQCGAALARLHARQGRWLQACQVSCQSLTAAPPEAFSIRVADEVALLEELLSRSARELGRPCCPSPERWSP